MRKVNLDGRLYEVPKHVSRVDSWKIRNGERIPGWHGRQVRWPGTCKFFTDAGYGGPRQALVHAAEFAKTFPGKRWQCDFNKGLRLKGRKKKDRRITEWHVVVYHPRKEKAAKKIYVGTDNTISLINVWIGFLSGMAMRTQLLQQHI